MLLRPPSPRRARSAWRGALLAALLLLVRPAAAQTEWSGSGPEGGWVISILQPFGPGGVTYVGTWGGGIFVSRDGVRFEPVSLNAPDAVVWELEYGPDDSGGTLYAATEDRGVLRARPGLTFWTPVNTGLNDPVQPAVLGIEVKPDEPTLITAATSRGVFHSRNRGSIWPDSLAWSVGVPFSDAEVSALAPNTTFALSYGSLFVSPDRGTTVREIDQGLAVKRTLLDLELWPGSLDSMVIADFDGRVYQLRGGDRLVPIGPSWGGGTPPRFYEAAVLEGPTPVLYVGADQGLFRSADVGATWSLLDGGLPTRFQEIWTLAPTDDLQQTLLLGSFRHGLVRTGPGGEEWMPWNDGIDATWSTSLWARGEEVLTGSAHGRVHRSLDGGLTWTEVTGDLDALQVTAVHRVRGRDRWLAGVDGALHHSDDGGTTWPRSQIDPGLDRVHRILQPPWMDDDELLASTDLGLRNSDDGGLGWAVPRGLEGVGGSVFALAAAADSTVVFAVEPQAGIRPGSFHVGRWGSDAWQSFEAPRFFGRRVRGLAFVGEGAEQLVVATAGGDLGGAGALYRIDHPTDPALRAFTSLDAGIPVSVVYARDLVRDREGNLYLGLSDLGVYRSDDGGQSWVDMSLGLRSTRIEELRVAAGRPDRIYAATLARGVFGRDLDTRVAVLLQGPWLQVEPEGIRARFAVSATERVQLWRRLDVAHPTLLWEGRVDATFSYLDPHAAFAGHGARSITYELRLLRGGHEVERAEASLALPLRGLPTQPRLLPNRPNPFNPRTTLALEVDQSARVVVEIYDLRGRLVRRLYEGDLPAGRHEWSWEGTDQSGRELASGVYLVRATVGQRRLAQRITMVR